MPLAKVYCSVSENFCIAWTNETGELDVDVTPAYGGVEVHGAAVLPAPRSLDGLPGFERNGRGVGFQMRGLETKSTSRRNGRGPDSFLKRLSIFV